MTEPMLRRALGGFGNAGRQERAIAGAKEAEKIYMGMVNAHQQEPVRWFGRRAVQWYD